MNYKIKGKLVYIGQIQHITDKFQKKEIVIEPEGERYTQKVVLNLLQSNVDMADNLQINDIVEAEFVIKGRESKGRYFNSIDVIRLAFIETPIKEEPEQSFSEFTEIGNIVAPDGFIPNDGSDLPF